MPMIPIVGIWMQIITTLFFFASNQLCSSRPYIIVELQLFLEPILFSLSILWRSSYFDTHYPCSMRFCSIALLWWAVPWTVPPAIRTQKWWHTDLLFLWLHFLQMEDSKQIAWILYNLKPEGSLLHNRLSTSTMNNAQSCQIGSIEFKRIVANKKNPIIWFSHTSSDRAWACGAYEQNNCDFSIKMQSASNHPPVNLSCFVFIVILQLQFDFECLCY